jgi:hypothetical protein
VDEAKLRAMLMLKKLLYFLTRIFNKKNKNEKIKFFKEINMAK